MSYLICIFYSKEGILSSVVYIVNIAAKNEFLNTQVDIKNENVIFSVCSSVSDFWYTSLIFWVFF